MKSKWMKLNFRRAITPNDKKKKKPLGIIHRFLYVSLHALSSRVFVLYSIRSFVHSAPDNKNGAILTCKSSRTVQHGLMRPQLPNPMITQLPFVPKQVHVGYSLAGCTSAAVAPSTFLANSHLFPSRLATARCLCSRCAT